MNTTMGHSKDSILNSLEIELVGLVYSGHRLTAHQVREVIDKYRDIEIEVDEWTWEDEELADTFSTLDDDDD